MFLRHSAHPARDRRQGPRPWDRHRKPAGRPPTLADCEGDCFGVFEAAELRRGLCKDCRRAER